MFENIIFFKFLDIFFIVFHSLLIVFNVLGWIWVKTRFWNFVTLNITAFSWFILGIWYGWGYCFCTDWHWQVRNMLGKRIESHSYISFLIESIFNVNIPAHIVDSITLLVFICSYVASSYFQIKKWWGNYKGIK
ncbi:MAG: DUF2784 domain-containing protein [Bacteroidales bacterium]|nr:DUF2784 domain-containing protein [Bacteroidales bacterium]